MLYEWIQAVAHAAALLGFSAIIVDDAKPSVN